MSKHVHEALGISFAELGALLGTRELLKRGWITHVKDDPNGGPRDGAHEFHMAIPCSGGNCGSISCIGGTMGLLMGMDEGDATRYVGEQDRHSVWHALFFPPNHLDWNKATPAKAVKAIDNFIKLGKPKWETLLPRD